MARRRPGIKFFLRLWVLSRGMYRSQWRWRRMLGMLWFLRTAKAFLAKRPVVISTTTLRPGTSMYVGTGEVPVKVKKNGREIEVMKETVDS